MVKYLIRSLFLIFWEYLPLTEALWKGKCLHRLVFIGYKQWQCSKFSKQGFNSTWTEIFLIFKLDLEKAEEPEIKLPTSVRSLKKQGSSRMFFFFFLCFLFMLYWLCQNLWLCVSQQTGNFLKRWEYLPPDLPLDKPVCRSRSNS